MRSIHAVVTGTVQGVGFRYTTHRMAQQVGLTGWVRNRPDGSVEVFAQGSEDAIERLITFLGTGPQGAAVTAVEIHESPDAPTLDGFKVRF